MSYFINIKEEVKGNKVKRSSIKEKKKMTKHCYQ